MNRFMGVPEMRDGIESKHFEEFQYIDSSGPSLLLSTRILSFNAFEQSVCHHRKKLVAIS